MTLEMPFKDNADLPDPAQGWSRNAASCWAANAWRQLELLLTRP
jgi:murein tripeptide amidase MpaA